MEILQIRAFSRRLCEKKKKERKLDYTSSLHGLLHTFFSKLFFKFIFYLCLSFLSIFFFHPSKEGKINLSCFVEKVNFTIFRS